MSVAALSLVAVIAGAPASPAAPVARAGSYVALGDSYTAGPGILLQQGRPVGCARSNRNYPHLVARRARLRLRDVSCSGARTEHLTSAQAVPGGVNRPQLDAVDARTTLVTLGIGGNDIGFGEIVASCFMVVSNNDAPCRRRYTAGGGDVIRARISETAPRVAGVLADIHRRAPAARVLVVNYPAIFPESGPGCRPVMPVAPGDVNYLREKQRELNAMLARQAAANGARLVDWYGPSIGHDACTLPGQRWVEPAVPTSPAAPVHPNAAGMAGAAAAVMRSVSGR